MSLKDLEFDPIHNKHETECFSDDPDKKTSSSGKLYISPELIGDKEVRDLDISDYPLVYADRTIRESDESDTIQGESPMSTVYASPYPPIDHCQEEDRQDTVMSDNEKIELPIGPVYASPMKF